MVASRSGRGEMTVSTSTASLLVSLKPGYQHTATGRVDMACAADITMDILDRAVGLSMAAHTTSRILNLGVAGTMGISVRYILVFMTFETGDDSTSTCITRDCSLDTARCNIRCPGGVMADLADIGSGR